MLVFSILKFFNIFQTPNIEDIGAFITLEDVAEPVPGLQPQQTALVSAQQTVLLSTKDKFSDIPGPDHAYDAHAYCVPRATYDNLLARFKSLKTKSHKHLVEKHYFKRSYEDIKKRNKDLKNGHSLPKVTQNRICRNRMGSGDFMTPALLDIYLSKR